MLKLLALILGLLIAGLNTREAVHAASSTPSIKPQDSWLFSLCGRASGSVAEHGGVTLENKEGQYQIELSPHAQEDWISNWEKLSGLRGEGISACVFSQTAPLMVDGQLIITAEDAQVDFPVSTGGVSVGNQVDFIDSLGEMPL